MGMHCLKKTPQSGHPKLSAVMSSRMVIVLFFSKKGFTIQKA
jgi:hypothetical protein